MGNARYIAIEGPIGVGKTSLARRLADSLDGELLLEEPEANPFLERFYRDPRGASLPAQLFFLFQRVQQIEQLRQSDIFAETRISDFLMDKDRLFAEINLDQAELALYDKVAESLDFEPPERLAEAYARYFHGFDSAPLLIVNAAIIDPVHNDDHFGLLLEQIGRIRSGRHFFNPVASAIA